MNKDMKKKLLSTMALIALCATKAAAQGIIVHHQDGSMSMFRTPNVESITMVDEENTYIFGTWYLGYWKNGSNTIHYDGTEYMTFAGPELTWGGKDKPGYYTVRYRPASKYFLASGRDGTIGTLRWNVQKQTDDQLILKDGDALRYFYSSKELAAGVLMDPSHNESTSVNSILRHASGKSNSTVTPMGKHFEGKHKTTDADRQWLANPANEPDKVASLTRWVKKTVNLYPYGDPKPADVNQHAIGDCCACAVWASLAYLYPDYIKHIITDNGNGTYTVGMYDPQGNPVDVCVSNTILCDGNGSIGQVTGKNNAVCWSTILEKAMMKYMTIYKTNGIEGIGTEHVAPLFTGCGDSFAFSPNSLYTKELQIAIEHCLTEGKICVGGFNKGDLLCGTLKTVTGHAFTYMFSTQESSIFGMRNPWGNGNNKEDGLLEIPSNRLIVQTIDARIVEPGAAAPYLRKDLLPYTPPAYIMKATDLGVSERLLRHALEIREDKELW